MKLVGTETRIPAQSILLFLTSIDISSANLLTNIPRSNPLNIDWGPAPPPEDGPPLSAGASRNKSLLPAQISGIVGAYLLSACIVSIGIFLVGRSLRRRIAAAYKARDIEMIETVPHSINTQFNPQFNPQSPASPRSFNSPSSWTSQEKSAPNPYVFPPTSPRSPRSPYSPTTPPSFGDPNVDSRVVERDQQLMERDLEEIYSYVMQQEEAKAAGVPISEMPLPAKLQNAGPAPPAASQRSPAKKAEKQRPANIMLVPEESKSPKSSRASSIISSIVSPRKSGFKKNLRISSPIQSPKDGNYPGGTAEEREPLTPRYYAPPPPPPIPTDQVPYQPTRQNSGNSVASHTRTIAEQLEPYGPGSTSAFHNNRSQASFGSQLSGPTLPSSPKPRSSLFPISTSTPGPSNNLNTASPNSAVTPSSTITPSSATSSMRQLPLRQFEPPMASPSYASFQQSTKTTVLERTTPDPSKGPTTAGLKTPWSAGAVPYSPYQPFTPMFPISPRLVTREDRKKMKKQEKKMGLSPRTELVADDLWDSGY
ncbi:hypothetical protein M430DRAFT_29040 [Amorphotheca resinae ATCC 22711]|jgi:hypothetical protein|uniref:Uncharacterized protein n=1 Tax=Amorphotheca resinae ATCC 22711 TaxID=857342 RepID=A0A2T3AYC5_AMORE|nr:hypothetical protein M430DRAFT_29040 [Amorphotheca resinae ATCC 22711]PSS15022.1 hypothetical protein M430DRAFT_29040 [Amorphotheca resinae ATCC 22711]